MCMPNSAVTSDFLQASMTAPMRCPAARARARDGAGLVEPPSPPKCLVEALVHIAHLCLS